MSRDQNNNVVVQYKPFGVALNFKPIVLSEDRISLQLRRQMAVPVPFLVHHRILQAKIGGEVRDLELGGGGEEILDYGLRRAVRQAAEDEVEGIGVDRLDLHELRQVEPGELRKDRRHRLTGVAVGGKRLDFHMRVTE